MGDYPWAVVEWLDATHEDDDALHAETEVGVLRYTVGYVLRDDDAGIVLAMDLTDGDYTKGFTIPRAYVKNVTALTKKRGG